VAALTAIMPDHLDRYGTMEAYVADKRIIYRGQDGGGATVAFDDDWGRSFLAETRARPLLNAERPLPAPIPGGWLENGAGFVRLYAGGPVMEVLPARVLVPGEKQKRNLLSAALVLTDLGLPPDFTAESLARFPGIEHRLEFFHEAGGIRFYNDTAATIPDAAAAAVEAFPGRLVLVTGGTDKNLDFAPLVSALAKAWGEGRLAPPLLLAGTGSAKLKPALDAAIRAALDAAASTGAGSTVVLSPGCASFGMFLNEFDRGLQWKEAVRRLA
jgi:UDP-N-acetylmuramoylalanine--D-glutamate ligase